MDLMLRTELQRYLKAKSESLLFEKLRSRFYSFKRFSRKGEPCFMAFSVTWLFIILTLSHLKL